MDPEVNDGGTSVSSVSHDDFAQASITRRYDRAARVYDLYDQPMDILGGVRGRRRRVLGRATGAVLEVGVGTGRNLDLYPDGVELTGIDVSAGMLERAHRRAAKLGLSENVSLQHADVQQLPFDDDSFDTAVATCVFCSVADPVRGLQEVSRVVRPGGTILLLEHVRPRNRVFGRVFDILNPVVSRTLGPNINRRTEDTVTAAGLETVEVRRSGVWREIVARPSSVAHPGSGSRPVKNGEVR